MYWDNGHMNAGWGIVMMLGMMTFWVLIVVAIAWFVRSTRTPHTPSGAAPSSAEQILAERLARGEIDTTEYQSRLTAMKPPR